MTTIHQLRDCPVCGTKMRRRSSESWPNYAKRKTCSRTCADKIRNTASSIADYIPMETAGSELALAMRGWRVLT